MSFHTSAQDIRVDGGHMLRARLRKVNGEEVDAEIDLNAFIGNNDGSFEWGGENFSKSAESISFAVEGGASVPVLRANLRNRNGESVPANINLAERIENKDGAFVFV
ncbi:ce873441-0667-47a3-bfba-aa72120037ea [Thermothielavioides terrestris]|uniref:Ce873441-0667-47a3-bfba-aa72120037ea n=1 Tax=Thermothielavioides terrestris TaxID=2587410 RepID=A0A3S4ARL2_9PEZI|nr:ce873441-0667-47a3-bfba-aa72120037ea [Thermothielavioides terrestris]